MRSVSGEMMKGIVYSIEQMFTLLLAGILAVSFSFILPSQITKLQPAIEQKDMENSAIIIANSLMSNSALITSSDGINHRGVLDSTKLDVNMIEKSSDYENITSCRDYPTALCKSSTTSETFILVLVSDTENQKGWFSVSKSGSDAFLQKMGKCFKDLKKGNPVIGKLFENDANLGDLLKLGDCGFTLHSNIMNHGNGVTIKYPDGAAHVGLLKLVLVQESKVKT